MLQEAQAWLAVLMACLGRDSVPQTALVLVNDLTQLVYYRAISQAPGGAFAAEVPAQFTF